MAVYEHRFRAMASTVQIRLEFPGDPQPSHGEPVTVISALARDEFSSVVRTMSRFDPDSELSTLNRNTGRWMRVSPLLLEGLRRAWEAYLYTNGVFDPRVLRHLERLGYKGCPLDLPHSDIPQPATQEPWVEFSADGLVRLHAPVDLGGIGKSLAVDRVRKAILRQVSPGDVTGFLINAGGDLYAWGVRDTGEPWMVGVEDPLNPSTITAVLQLETPTAVCTSSVARRRWFHEGNLVHHLIDPATGQPADSPYLSVTCAYPDPVAAEIFTKSYLIRPLVSLRVWPLPEYIWWVTKDGRLLTTARGAGWVTWSRQRREAR